jgi:Domain of unknown function (DUF1707)
MPAISPALRVASSGRSLAAGSGLRVSDADRAAVADELSRHYGEGRLDAEEFGHRLDRAMSARTYQDLSGLLDDLPDADGTAGLSPKAASRRQRPPQQAVPGRPAARQRSRGLPRLAKLIVFVVMAVVAVRVISWAAEPALWVCVVLGIALLAIRSPRRRR